MSGEARQTRKMLLLVPAVDGSGVLAIGGGLPTFDVVLNEGESSIEGAGRALRELGLEVAILECTVDQTDQAELGTANRSMLVEVAAPPTTWELPPAAAWCAWEDAVIDPAPGIRAKTLARIAELRGEKPESAKRPAWTAVGWYGDAVEWIDGALTIAGRAAPDRVVQVRHCGISAVMRVEAPDGRTWFKAAFPPFHNEAPISELLARIAPGMTCVVVASDDHRGWLLLDEMAGNTEAVETETARRAIDTLVQIQLATAQHHPALLQAGCLRRPLTGLGLELADALTAPVADRLGLTGIRIAELVAQVDRAAASIAAIGFPDMLVHGDFHPGNVATSAAGSVLFDWSDAAISHPIVDVATWSWWFDGDAHKTAELWSLFLAAWQQAFGVDGSRIDRADADVVAGAFHLVSYVRLLSGLDPLDVGFFADGLVHFADLLTRAATDAQGV